MKVYSVYTILDGKWEITIYIAEDSDYEYSFNEPPDLRCIVDNHYDESPEVLGRILLNDVLDAEIVQVKLLTGPAVYMRKSDLN